MNLPTTNYRPKHFDTADFRLLRDGITRHMHSGGGDAGWRLSSPPARAPRTDMRFPRCAAEAPPPELEALVRRVTRYREHADHTDRMGVATAARRDSVHDHRPGSRLDLLWPDLARARIDQPEVAAIRTPEVAAMRTSESTAELGEPSLYYVRRLRDRADSAKVEAMHPQLLVDTGRSCGHAPARGYARSRGRVTIEAYPDCGEDAASRLPVHADRNGRNVEAPRDGGAGHPGAVRRRRERKMCSR